MTRRRLNPDRPVTGRQLHVLLILANRGDCAANDWSAWYPMRESTVRSAINSLANRGYVDVAGFTHGARASRTYKITREGSEALDRQIADEDQEAMLEELEDS